MSNITKFKLYTYIVNCGDGSAAVKYFRSKESRDAFAESEEESGEAFCESEGELEFFIDELGQVRSSDELEDWYKKHPDYIKIKD